MRSDFRISPNGRHAICLAADPETGLRLETWQRQPDLRWAPARRLGPVRHPQMLIDDDGRALVQDRDGDGWAIRRHHPAGTSDRLTPPGWDTECRLFRQGLAITYEEGFCELWALGEAGLTRRLARIPGVLMSGLPITPDHRRLAIERAREPGGSTDVVIVDLDSGEHGTLLDTGPEQHDVVLQGHPPTGLLVIGTNAGGVRRVGWTRLGRGEPVRFPESLNPAGEGVRPLAVSPEGDELLIARTLGTHTRLSLCHLGTDRITPVPLPPGHVPGPARWTADALTLTFSAPDTPTTLISTRSLGVRPRSTAGRARVVRFGDLEAITYGDWRTSEHVLIALHGGPLAAWRFEHHPLLSRIADAGVAIVAPNQRGSTGYGVAHTEAIRSGWGGADLDDVLGLARALGGERRLRLFGESYGAYLALLAAAREPDRWERCVAVSPFISGPRLFAAATRAGVRDLVRTLGGLEKPQDVLRVGGRIRADLLIAHGTQDPMVPVEQARELHAGLVAGGRSVRYREVPDGTHELTLDPYGSVADDLVTFLTAPGRPTGDRADLLLGRG